MSFYDLVAPTMFIVVFYLVIGLGIWLIFTVPKSWPVGLVHAIARWQWPIDPASRLINVVALTMLAFGIYALVVSADETLRSLGPEFLGIGVSILVIDRLYSFRAKHQLKQTMIKQIANPVNEDCHFSTTA